ncbi:hypothetical protein ACOME3_000315 [Neoechinorhynchus agilis]
MPNLVQLLESVLEAQDSIDEAMFVTRLIEQNVDSFSELQVKSKLLYYCLSKRSTLQDIIEPWVKENVEHVLTQENSAPREFLLLMSRFGIFNPFFEFLTSSDVSVAASAIRILAKSKIGDNQINDLADKLEKLRKFHVIKKIERDVPAYFKYKLCRKYNICMEIRQITEDSHLKDLLYINNDIEGLCWIEKKLESGYEFPVTAAIALMDFIRTSTYFDKMILELANKREDWRTHSILKLIIPKVRNRKSNFTTTEETEEDAISVRRESTFYDEIRDGLFSLKGQQQNDCY